MRSKDFETESQHRLKRRRSSYRTRLTEEDNLPVELVIFRGIEELRIALEIVDVRDLAALVAERDIEEIVASPIVEATFVDVAKLLAAELVIRSTELELLTLTAIDDLGVELATTLAAEAGNMIPLTTFIVNALRNVLPSQRRRRRAGAALAEHVTTRVRLGMHRPALHICP